MLGTVQRQNWVGSELPCWLLLPVQEVLVVLDLLVGPLAEVAGLVVDLGVPAAGPAVAAGLVHPVVVGEPGLPKAVVAAVVAVGLHSLLLAWPLLLVLVLPQLVIWLLLPLLWLQSWLS